jgi:hypothetical protein
MSCGGKIPQGVTLEKGEASAGSFHRDCDERSESKNLCFCYHVQSGDWRWREKAIEIKPVRNTN